MLTKRSSFPPGSTIYLYNPVAHTKQHVYIFHNKGSPRHIRDLLRMEGTCRAEQAKDDGVLWQLSQPS